MDEKMIQVPYTVHESGMARMERMNRRSWIVTIILIVLLFLTNGAWIYYESQFEYFETSIEAEQDGDVNIVGGGDVNYGAESKDQDEGQEEEDW